MADKKAPPETASYYAHLVTYPKRKMALGLLVALGCVVAFGIATAGLFAQKSWIVIALPLCFLGSLFIAFPATEEWEYRPWQAKAQQYERHFFD